MTADEDPDPGFRISDLFRSAIQPRTALIIWPKSEIRNPQIRNRASPFRRHFRRLRVRLRRRRWDGQWRIRAKRYKLSGSRSDHAQLAAGNRVNPLGLRRKRAAPGGAAGWFRITAPFSSALLDPITVLDPLVVAQP